MLVLTKRDKRLLKQISSFLLVVAVITGILWLIPSNLQPLATALSLIVSAVAAYVLDITSDEARNSLKLWNKKRVKSEENPEIAVELRFNYSLKSSANREEISEEIADSLGISSDGKDRFTISQMTDYGEITKTINLDSSGRATGDEDSDASLLSDGGSSLASSRSPGEVTNIRGELRAETTYNNLQSMITTLYTAERDINTAFSPFRATSGEPYTIHCYLNEQVDLDIEGMCYLIEPEGINAWTSSYDIYIESNEIKVENLAGEELARVEDYIYKLVTFYG